MRRFAILVASLTVALVAAALPVRARQAYALDVWCWDDPVFEINGKRVAVNLGLRTADLAHVQHVEVTLTVPQGTNAKVVYIETTYFTPKVNIVYVPASGKNLDVVVGVKVQAAKTFDYQITVTTGTSTNPVARNMFALTNQHHRLAFRLK